MIVWVLGGTAVGKKHFIRRALENPAAFGLPANIQPFWVEDGDKSPDEILEAQAKGPLIVRWQWGRENNFEPIHARDVEQRLYVVRTDITVQYQRMLQREGASVWPLRMLQREAEDVHNLAQDSSIQFGFLIRYFDGN